MWDWVGSASNNSFGRRPGNANPPRLRSWHNPPVWQTQCNPHLQEGAAYCQMRSGCSALCRQLHCSDAMSFPSWSLWEASPSVRSTKGHFSYTDGGSSLQREALGFWFAREARSICLKMLHVQVIWFQNIAGEGKESGPFQKQGFFVSSEVMGVLSLGSYANSLN